MQIQLTQDELKDAVRQYVAKDFNLEGRTLSISFTATRGDAGIITNLSISKDGDVVIPGFTNAPADTPVVPVAVPTAAPTVETAALAAVAPVVASDTATTAAAVAKTEVPEVVQEDVATQGDAAEAAETKLEEVAVAAVPAKTTSSLFG